MSSRELSFSLGIGPHYLGDIQDQEIALEFQRLYLAVNTLATKLDEYTGSIPYNLADRAFISPQQANRAFGINRFYGYATADLLRGTIAYFNSSGQLAKADSDAAASARALVIVLEDTALGNYAPVARQAVLGGFAGLTAGSNYYVSSTAGGISTSAGTHGDSIGFAVNSTTLAFYPLT